MSATVINYSHVMQTLRFGSAACLSHAQHWYLPFYPKEGLCGPQYMNTRPGTVGVTLAHCQPDLACYHPLLRRAQAYLSSR